MCSATTADDVRLTRYRLQVVERMPDSPLKQVLLDALRSRLQRLGPSQPSPGPSLPHVPRAA